MRKEPTLLPDGGANLNEAAGQAASPATSCGTLGTMLQLEEPMRTEALEKAANSGLTVYLRSKTGAEVRVRYGSTILVVPPDQPKPFAAAHAIHLLFVASKQVEEVEG